MHNMGLIDMLVPGHSCHRHDLLGSSPSSCHGAMTKSRLGGAMHSLPFQGGGQTRSLAILSPNVVVRLTVTLKSLPVTILSVYLLCPLNVASRFYDIQQAVHSSGTTSRCIEIDEKRHREFPRVPASSPPKQSHTSVQGCVASFSFGAKSC